MKFRRVWTESGMTPADQVMDGVIWRQLDGPPPFARCMGPRIVGGGMTLLPFQPASFRDFMLYERHVIDSTKGYARRFMPAAYRAAMLYERLSGKTFHRFKPRPIWYKQPIYYLGNALTFVPSGTEVVAPSYTTAFDYELELGFVLAKPLFNPTPEEAIRAIGAFVVLCDFSARDVQRAEMESGFGPQKSKHFLSSMSEMAVSADEILPRVEQLSASILIDGKEVCRTSTAGMQFSLGQVLAHAAKDEQLFPGELFGTGTLPGGCALENGHWLQDGSNLELRIEGIGAITHNIIIRSRS